MLPSLFITLSVFSIALLEAKHLPSYIVPCKKSDPNLNTCAKQHAIDATARILHGDRSYKIPSFTPFSIPLIDVKGTTGITFQLKDLKLYGLNTTQIKDVNFDLPNNHMYVKVFIPQTQTISQYLMDGKLLSLVIKGEGPAEIISDNVTVEYFIDYVLINKPDGKRYVDVDALKTNLTLNFSKTHYNFGNLFGGNKLLGDNFNNLLNENPKEVDEISGGTNKVIISSIVSSIFNPIFKAVPFDDIFID
ncbi:unnamed protein product [Psylliodes chrysocephalus]|uniref:Takeout n=1 Tax=Psylliodes chrysocephalus TaxID=3402493 RepID=A0A9P0G9B1_9CUCU|nr:unnamed protein product [Psylliodes chrysocephala]